MNNMCTHANSGIDVLITAYNSHAKRLYELNYTAVCDAS